MDGGAKRSLLGFVGEPGDCCGRAKGQNMKGKLLQAIAGAVVVVILAASGAPAQSPSPTPQAEAAPQLTPEQLDPMLAPIALYPDGLLADILMAATYPLEVVEADRWLEDPHNASLKGEQLAAALEQQAGTRA